MATVLEHEGVWDGDTLHWRLHIFYWDSSSCGLVLVKNKLCVVWVRKFRAGLKADPRLIPLSIRRPLYSHGVSLVLPMEPWPPFMPLQSLFELLNPTTRVQASYASSNLDNKGHCKSLYSGKFLQCHSRVADERYLQSQALTM